MEGEPNRRRGEPLKAVAVHVGNVESCGAAVNSGRRATPEFLGCGVNSTGRMNGLFQGERRAKTWARFVR